MTERLDPLRQPLWGSRLIEASAGTGKTWTIAALYLRLVLGHGGPDEAFGRPLLPGEILVMTFTRAATRELSDRIRDRLAQAARCFRGDEAVPAGDRLLAGLLADHPGGPARSQAAWRLAQAADAMDEAAVLTIDAWCQRMLREHAFDSGNLFDETLLADEDGLRGQAVRDYWRQSLYPLPPPLLARALAVWPGVERLDADVRQLLPRLADAGPAPQGDLAALLQGLEQSHREALAILKQGWAERATLMRAWLEAHCASPDKPFHGSKLRLANAQGWLDKLGHWAHDPALVEPDLTPAAWHRLTPAGMQEALNKDKMVSWPGHFEAFEAMARGLRDLPDVRGPLRWHAAAWVHRRMAWLKQQEGTFGFNDMLERLAQALQGPHAARLRERIVQQYPVALIDEFQDTSPLQYRIFDLLYRVADNERARALFLIGDPKQSIYRFRGADIHSYLRARQATRGRHAALDTNHRSTQALVAAVNHVFSLAEARGQGGAFAFARPGGASPLPFEPVAARGRPEQLVDAHGTVPAMTLVLDDELSSKGVSQRRMAGHAAEHIVSLLNDTRADFRWPDGACTPLRPADVAVLVRSGAEAALVREALARRGLPTVYLSDKDSVFDSPEAADLLTWLRAVASPRDLRLARTAHASALVGLSLDELRAQADDDALWDQRLADLLQLQLVWQR